MARKRTYRNDWDYHPYYPKTQPKAVENGIALKKQRGEIGEKWWAKRWLSVLDSFHMGARLDRGKTYARKGQVLSIEIQGGKISAKVQGSMPRPYNITISLDPFTKQEWQSVLDIMASRAIFAAKLLSGEMPTQIEEVFQEAHISLFPNREKDLKTDCSCPDDANPCKHIAAVYLLLGEQFEEDPFLIFKLRGMPKDELITNLRKYRVSMDDKSNQEPAADSSPHGLSSQSNNFAVEVPLAETIDTFYGEENEDAFSEISIDLTPPDIEHMVIKRLGKCSISMQDSDVMTRFQELQTMLREIAIQKYNASIP
jgi:uncharacterized Zn finger protein